jgi:hypothetical protein
VALKYDEVVPWGRSFDEYQRMFALTTADLARRVLGCGDGPASFNAHLSAQGGRVVSVDPLYTLAPAQIQARITATYDTVIAQTRANQAKFVWDSVGTVEALGVLRMAAMQAFLADYGPGQRAGRYVAAALPDLPFAPATFDLALCSHFLFLYTDHLSLDFHHAAVAAMCRAAREVRLFPLLTYNADLSPYVAPVMAHLRAAGYRAEVERVPYEFQRGGNQMLRVRG